MTAVEFLVSKLNPYGLSESQTLVFDQAKELEKQQIISARINGVCEGIYIGGNPVTEGMSKNHEIYYNETFKNK